MPAIRIGPSGKHLPGCGSRSVDAVLKQREGDEEADAVVKRYSKFTHQRIYSVLGDGIIIRRLYEEFHLEEDRHVVPIIAFGESEIPLRRANEFVQLFRVLSYILGVRVFVQTSNQMVEYQTPDEIPICFADKWEDIPTGRLLPRSDAIRPDLLSGEEIGNEVPIRWSGMDYPKALRIDHVERWEDESLLRIIEKKPTVSPSAVSIAVGQILMYHAALQVWGSTSVSTPELSGEKWDVEPVIRFGCLPGRPMADDPLPGALTERVEVLAELGIQYHLRTGNGGIESLTSHLESQ